MSWILFILFLLLKIYYYRTPETDSPNPCSSIEPRLNLTSTVYKVHIQPLYYTVNYIILFNWEYNFIYVEQFIKYILTEARQKYRKEYEWIEIIISSKFSQSFRILVVTPYMDDKREVGVITGRPFIWNNNSQRIFFYWMRVVSFPIYPLLTH